MSRPKHMMEIQSEGYPTTPCERLEYERQEARRAARGRERDKEQTAEDLRQGRRVCRPCLRSKGPRYRFPSAGCEHRRAAASRADSIKRFRQRMDRKGTG